MEAILEQLGLSTLLERFSDERWDFLQTDSSKFWPKIRGVKRYKQTIVKFKGSQTASSHNRLFSNSKEARLLQAIIDSFLGADRNFLFLLNFDIISLKCSAVTIGIQCTFFLKNDALTWKDRLHITSAKKRPFAYQIFES